MFFTYLLENKEETRLAKDRARGARAGSNRGFISLISAIVIGLVIMLAVITLAQRGIAGRFLLLDFESKEISSGLAAACVETARIAIANDPAYQTASTSVAVGSGSCMLVSVARDTPTVGQSRIETTGEDRGATTNLRVVVDAATLDIVSWVEVPSL